MSANPDPRLDEIEAKIGGLCGIIAFPETPEERDAAENELTADVSYLLAELRKAHEALERVEALAHHWETIPALRKGTAAADLRAAVAAAKETE